LYLQAYRDLGIFQENAVNRILEDVVAACSPREATVVGDFNPRGGVASRILAKFPRKTPSGG
jgi:7-cyano-7-deazaguanine reductase